MGVAVGGLWRTSLAAEITALVVVATYLIDLLAPAFKLPDWVHQLALTAHFGQPMVGVWDASGILACAAIAVGGLLIGAWGSTHYLLRESAVEIDDVEVRRAREGKERPRRGAERDARSVWRPAEVAHVHLPV